MHTTDNELIYEAVVAIVAAGLIYLAYCLGGFLGVGVLGLLVAYIAFQADLNKTGSFITMARSGRSGWLRPAKCLMKRRSLINAVLSIVDTPNFDNDH